MPRPLRIRPRRCQARSPSTKSRLGEPTSTHIEDWLNGRAWDVIVANWGLHDLRPGRDDLPSVTPETYGRHLRMLADSLAAASVRWLLAPTPPVPDDCLGRRAASERAFNAALIDVAEEQRAPSSTSGGPRWRMA